VETKDKKKSDASFFDAVFNTGNLRDEAGARQNIEFGSSYSEYNIGSGEMRVIDVNVR
jgi:hypothetical protein